ncbi:MAG: hypothetical protein U0835_16680 [Isosphaeraceae bacterium]
MAGYSGTPLVKKLGLKEGSRLALVSAPEDFDETLGTLPTGASTTRALGDAAEVSLLFVIDAHDFPERFAREAARVGPFGAVWVAWPKKASGVKTDVTEGLVRTTGLRSGLVDVKVCAIDDVWSGLKFVTRVEDRPRNKS